MQAPITLGLAAAIEVLLRVLAVIRIRRPLRDDFDLEAVAAAVGERLGASWAGLYGALAASREDLEEHGPLSSRRGAPNDEQVTRALLREEATEAADGALLDVAEHFLPASRGLLLPEVAALVNKNQDHLRAAGARAGVPLLEAWTTVYRSLHQRQSAAPTLQPGEAGDEGDDGPTTERTFPELVLELPATVQGAAGDRRLAAVARELRELLALRADVAPRGRGLVLRLRLPVGAQHPSMAPLRVAGER